MIFSRKYFFQILVLVQVILTVACGRKNHSDNQDKTLGEFQTAEFGLRDFEAITNFGGNSDSIKPIELDYTDAINTGFIIPTEKQVGSGNFVCRFSILNKTGHAIKFRYKIYFQNESYKFQEIDSATGKLNINSSENFYGSWQEADVLFKSTTEIPSDDDYHEIFDSIRIMGNPRNEPACFVNGKNDRWKRNPRVGIYSFLLVVSSEENISQGKIPAWIQNIALQKENKYVSPYYFFLYGDGKAIPNSSAVLSKSSLKVVAHPDLGGGIFYDKKLFKDFQAYSVAENNCGNDSSRYRNAAFSQFIHYIDASTRLENIPIIADVLKDNYSKREYNWNRSFYRKEESIGGTPMTAEVPCESVVSDPLNKKIVMHNPKSTVGKWKKENVGIISRHGLCYGKIRIKAKMTELLNRNNVWNGITNAIWMIYQGDDGIWNLRRPCKKEGYMETYYGGADDKRVNRVSYSEIDFEILKTPPYCPDQTFPPVFKNPTNDPRDVSSWNTPLPPEILKDDGNVTVACTNWDMACWEPKNFGVGCNTINYQGKEFQTHQWDHWYRALTEKAPQPDDSLFGQPYYFFEIEWKPTEIIWRIGSDPSRMFVVGYMNEEITSIPNNQMLLIVTQEFHNTRWWPGSPYQQSNIPFPANDIFGEIYDVTIE